MEKNLAVSKVLSTSGVSKTSFEKMLKNGHEDKENESKIHTCKCITGSHTKPASVAPQAVGADKSLSILSNIQLMLLFRSNKS